MKLRVACVQLNAHLGKVDANITKVKQLLSTVKKEIDLILLPEFAVTGYNFSTRDEIEPYLAKAGSGPSATLARDLSKAYNCTTVIGYPEEDEEKIYNSAIVIDDQGTLVHNYRKTHLYDTDEGFGCSENPDNKFMPVSLKLGKGDQKTSVLTNLGICMDLNPYKFKAPFYEFEFASACLLNEASLILVPTAWLSENSPSIKEDLSKEEKIKQGKILQKQFEDQPDYPVQNADKPSQLTVNYWILRFFPFLSHFSNYFPRKKTKTTVVMCNRVGVEGDTMYTGSSSIFQFDPTKPDTGHIDLKNHSVEVLGSLGQATEGVLYREIEI